MPRHAGGPKREPLRVQLEDGKEEFIWSPQLLDIFWEDVKNLREESRAKVVQVLHRLFAGSPKTWAQRATHSRSGRSLWEEAVGNTPIGDTASILWWVELEAFSGRQHLVVYRLVKPTDVEQAAAAAARFLCTFSDKYLQATLVHTRGPDGSFVPHTCNISFDLFRDGAAEEIPWGWRQRPVSLEKRYAVAERHLRLLKDQSMKNIQLPCVLDSEEQSALDKVLHEPLFILGRSGTGKTTVQVHALYYLHMAERDFAFRDDDEVPGPILLVTRSPILARSIQKLFSRMCLEPGAHGEDERLGVEDSDEEAELGALPSSFLKEDVPAGAAPLITSWAAFLLIADATVPLVERVPSLRERFFRPRQGNQMERALRRKQEAAGAEVQAGRYDLQDELGFEAFEAQLGVKLVGNPPGSGILGKEDSLFVVYKEIITVIEGSLHAICSDAGYLSREEYLSGLDSEGKQLPEMRDSSLRDQGTRSRAYTAFEAYLKFKRQAGQFDRIDPVRQLVQRARKWKRKKRYETVRMLSAVFIDEVQDLVPAEILLLQLFCEHTRCWIFAGDTAQTISKGVEFRFGSIRRLYFEQFLKGADWYKAGPKASYDACSICGHEIRRQGGTLLECNSHYASHTKRVCGPGCYGTFARQCTDMMKGVGISGRHKREWAEARGKLNCPVPMCALYMRESAITFDEEEEDDDEEEDEDNRMRSTEDVPPIHHLTRNHRSQQGILDLAGSLIDAITTLFPEFVDQLPREEVVVRGLHLLPVFIHSMSFDEALSIIFRQADNAGQRVLEFGAKQGILVWSEESRERIKKRFPMSLVMTIHDCKGLEFSDVLIVSPFSDMARCQANGQTLWNFLHACRASGHVHAPADFSPEKHGILCSWLKSLYVAVTRARERAWIFEEGEAGKPALAYWSAAQLVRGVSSVAEANADPGFTAGFAQSSTAEEFVEEAHNLLRQQQFTQAAVLFFRAERGGHKTAKWWRQYAETSEKGRVASLRPATAAKELHVEVGKEFCSIAREVRALPRVEIRAAPPIERVLRAALASFLEALDFPRAARVYEELHLWPEAAKCWEEVQKWKKAGMAWKEAGKPVAAMHAFHRGWHWEEFLAEAEAVTYLPQAHEVQPLARKMARHMGRDLAKLTVEEASREPDWELLRRGLLLLEKGPRRDEVIESLEMPRMGMRIMEQEGSLEECAVYSLQIADWGTAVDFYARSGRPDLAAHSRLLQFLRDLGLVPSQKKATRVMQAPDTEALLANSAALLPADQQLQERAIGPLCSWARCQSSRDRIATLQELFAKWSEPSQRPSGHALRFRILACMLGCPEHHLDSHADTGPALLTWLHDVAGAIQQLLHDLDMRENQRARDVLMEFFLVEESPLLPQAYLVFEKLLCPNEKDLSLQRTHFLPTAVAALRLLHVSIARLTLSLCQGLLQPMVPCWSHFSHGKCDQEGGRCRRSHDKTPAMQERASKRVVQAFAAWHKLRSLAEGAGTAQARRVATKAADVLGVEATKLDELLRHSCTDLLLQVFLPPSASFAILPSISGQVRQAGGNLIRAKLDELVLSLKTQTRPPSLPELLPAPCALLLAPLVDYHGLQALSDVATEQWRAAGRDWGRQDSEKAAWQLLCSFFTLQASRSTSSCTGAGRTLNYEDLLNFFHMSHNVLAQAVREQSVCPQAMCYLAERVVVWANVLITQFSNTTLPTSLVQTHLAGHGRLAALAAENKLPDSERHVPFNSLQRAVDMIKQVLCETYTAWTERHGVRFQETTLRLLVILFSSATINWFRSIRNTRIRHGSRWKMRDRMSCMNDPAGFGGGLFDPTTSLPKLLQWLTLSLPNDERVDMRQFDRMTPWFHSVMCELGDPLCILHRRDSSDQSPGWTRAERPLSFAWTEFLPQNLGRAAFSQQDLMSLRPDGQQAWIRWPPVNQVVVYPSAAQSTRADGLSECDFGALDSQHRSAASITCDGQDSSSQDFVLNKSACDEHGENLEEFVCDTNEQAAAELLQPLNITISVALILRRRLRLLRQRLALKVDPRVTLWCTERAWLLSNGAQVSERLCYLFRVLPVLRHQDGQILRLEELRQELRRQEDKKHAGSQEAIDRLQDAIDELKILGKTFTVDHHRVRIRSTEGVTAEVERYWEARSALSQDLLLPDLLELGLGHLWLSGRVQRGLRAWLQLARTRKRHGRRCWRPRHT